MSILQRLRSKESELTTINFNVRASATDHVGHSALVTTGAASSLAYNDNDASVDTITRTVGSFITDGFAVGDSCIIGGTATNEDVGAFTLTVVEALTLTCATGTLSATEGAVTSTVSIADPSIYVEGADSIVVSWDSSLDTLGTHASADWDLNVHSCPTETGTYDLTATTYQSWDTKGDDAVESILLTPGPAWIKVRVDEMAAAIASPTIYVLATWR